MNYAALLLGLLISGCTITLPSDALTKTELGDLTTRVGNLEGRATQADRNFQLVGAALNEKADKPKPEPTPTKK